jgi:hypothetical protein
MSHFWITEVDPVAGTITVDAYLPRNVKPRGTKSRRRRVARFFADHPEADFMVFANVPARFYKKRHKRMAGK